MTALRGPLMAVSAFVLAWPLAGYPATLWLLGKRRARVEPAAHELPSVSVIVPTYQEASNIEPRLRNLAGCAYPRDRFEVIVVDSASPDGTADIASTVGETMVDTSVRVIREATRDGKAAAINTALAACTSDLVIITDAPTRFSGDAVRIVASEFDDPAVGAATGYFDVTGDEGALQREEATFWRMRNLLRTLEARVDSTPFLSGELCCFRRKLVESLDTDTLADDMNVALQVRRAGYRVVVNNAARFSEPRSNRARELMETKTRRAAGGVQELLRARGMACNPRFGWFGMLILPSAFLYYLPLRLPAAFVVGWSALPWLRKLPLPVSGGVTLAALLVARKAMPRLGMLAFNEFVFLSGWWRICFRRMDVRWIQERSTRLPVEPHESSEKAHTS